MSRDVERWRRRRPQRRAGAGAVCFGACGLQAAQTTGQQARAPSALLQPAHAASRCRHGQFARLRRGQRQTHRRHPKTENHDAHGIDQALHGNADESRRHRKASSAASGEDARDAPAQFGAKRQNVHRNAPKPEMPSSAKNVR